MNRVICKGQFKGGEIEPGTFHGGDIEAGAFYGGEIEPGTFHNSCHSKDSASKAGSEGFKKDEKDGSSDVESSAEDETSSGNDEGKS